jgi:NSS family neurotransmitter:Na+ symporter
MNQDLKSTQTESFTSRWGLIVSVLGIAIGTGNIWRFPRIAANNGGEDGAGAFLVAWLVFLLMWSIPLIIAEYAIGRNGRKGAIGSFIKLAGEKYAWMGGFVGFVAMAIMFYYSVVTGWCIYYFGSSLFFPLPADSHSALLVWDGFQSSWLPVLFHALAMLLAGMVILKGVRAIERVNKILIPLLLLILLISFVRAITLPGSMEGIKYLFTPDWSTLLQPGIWLEALTQNAWDTGAGWGLILTYAAYMKSKDNITLTALQTGFGNNIISLLAAVIIFSTVFGTLGSSMTNSEILEVMQTSGPASTGLTFIWMPQLFLEIPGGRLFAILFFLGLTFAAFSSLISMVELSSKMFVDVGVSRKKAATWICIAGFTFGVPSAMNLDVFANQDFVWGLGLMISGAFIAFVVIKSGVTDFRLNLINTGNHRIKSGKWFEVLIKYIIPIEVVVLLGWWIYRSAFEFAPETWFNPLEVYSVATCVVQWSIAAGTLIVFNKQISNLTVTK